jgi:hypothetical protein
MTEQSTESEEIEERISYIVVQEYDATWNREGHGQVDVAQEEVLRLTHHETCAVMHWIKSNNKKLRLISIVPPERINVAKITADYDARIKKEMEQRAIEAEKYKKREDAKAIARKQKQLAKLKKELGVE